MKSKVIAILMAVGMTLPVSAFAAPNSVTIDPVQDTCVPKGVTVTGSAHVRTGAGGNPDRFLEVETGGVVYVDEQVVGNVGGPVVETDIDFSFSPVIQSNTAYTVDAQIVRSDNVVFASDSASFNVSDHNAVDGDGNCIYSSGGGLGISVLPYEDEPECDYIRAFVPTGLCLKRTEAPASAPQPTTTIYSTWFDFVEGVMKTSISYLPM